MGLHVRTDFLGIFRGPFSAKSFGFHPSQPSQMNSNPGIAAIPIRSVTPVTPTNGPMKNKFETNPVSRKNGRSTKEP